MEKTKANISQSFIKKYAELHGKEKSPNQVLNLLSGLQSAIRRKLIRKEDPHAGMIEHIQEQLKSLYTQMEGLTLVYIDNHEKYQSAGLGFIKTMASAVVARLVERKLDHHLDKKKKEKERAGKVKTVHLSGAKKKARKKKA